MGIDYRDLGYDDNRNDFDKIELFGIDNVLELAEQLKASEDKIFQGNKLTAFFRYALSAYYGGTNSWMAKETGDLIYNLSDQLSQEKRRYIYVYPRKDAQPIKDREGHICGFTSAGENMGAGWYSLEDWRIEWEKANPVILGLDMLVSYDEMKHLAKF